MIRDWEYYRFKIFDTPLCESCGEGMTLETNMGKYYCPVCDKEEMAELIKNPKEWWPTSRIEKLIEKD